MRVAASEAGAQAAPRWVFDSTDDAISGFPMYRNHGEKLTILFYQ